MFKETKKDAIIKRTGPSACESRMRMEKYFLKTWLYLKKRKYTVYVLEVKVIKEMTPA